MDDIVYEPHPVSEKRRAELEKQGKRIIDIKFKPDDVKPKGITPKGNNPIEQE